MLRSIHGQTCRVLVAVDFSAETVAAMRTVEDMVSCRPTAVEAFYLWPADATCTASPADQAAAALEALFRDREAIENFDLFSTLAQRGAFTVGGWLVRGARGHALPELAALAGYDRVIVGIAPPAAPTHRFVMHRAMH